MSQVDDAERYLELARPPLNGVGELLLSRADAVGNRVLVDAESLGGPARAQVFLEIDAQRRGEARGSVVLRREGAQLGHDELPRLLDIRAGQGRQRHIVVMGHASRAPA